MPRESASFEDLTAAMKTSAAVLREAAVPFVLAGGLAVYARGGTPSGHDVDFLIREEDVPRSLEALTQSGFTTAEPPEGWLVKAYDGDVLIDLIFRPVERPVTSATLADSEALSLAGISLPVLSATELLIHGLLRLTTQECDLTSALSLVRAVREQIDFQRVRDQTKPSPYARAFLALAEDLHLVGSEGSQR
jgi:hypothetical protein